GLARRVAVELKRWKIEVDDSAGRPLARTPPGILARLVAEVALGGCEAETLLALAKHPLATFGMAAKDARWSARNLERAVLRGPRLQPGLAALRHALVVRHAERYPPEGIPPKRSEATRHLSRERWETARKLAEQVEAALSTLERLAAADGLLSLGDLVEAHHAALLAVAGDGKSGGAALFADEAGE